MWLDRKRPTYLYGYSQLDMTKDKAQKLRRAGFDVRGYIDQNAEKLREHHKEHFFSIDELKSDETRAEAQVIILLQNARQHEVVLQALQSIGIYRVLAAPKEVRNEKEKAEMLSYECFLEDDFDEQGSYETLDIPIEHIRTYRDNEVGGIALEKAYPYIEIINYGLKREADIETYCSFMGRNDEDFLRDRRELVAFFKERYTDNKEYFRYAAIHGRWQNDSLEIVDGHHRAVFLFCMGEKCIPLRVKKDDINRYKEWLKHGGRENNTKFEKRQDGIA